MADIKGVFDRLLPYWSTQHDLIASTIALQKNKTTHRINQLLFAKIKDLVYDRALIRILGEKAKLHRCIEEQGSLLQCDCTIQALIGLPCFYTLYKRMKSPDYLQPLDIHAYWWYHRLAEGSFEVDRKTLVLQPLKVKGKGRPKGSKNKKKDEGESSKLCLYYLTNSVITILI